MLNQDYKDIIQSLLKNKVNYLLVGAYALAAHGIPRATGDIDFFVEATEKNAKNVYAALKAFGADISELDEMSFVESDVVFQIGVAPRRIDLVTKIDGVTFKEAWKNHEVIDIDGLQTPILSKNDLIRNKEATGREKDRLDVDELKKS